MLCQKLACTELSTLHFVNTLSTLCHYSELCLYFAMSSCSFPVFQEQEGEWTSSKTFLMEGIRIHDFFTSNPAALRDYIVNFETRGDDVFVVTYPKSGKL